MGMWSEIIFKYWKVRQWFDRRRTYTPSEQDTLAGYYTTAINIFRALEIDVASMPPQKQHLYHMMLVYADHDEAVMPKEARTATLLNFLHSQPDNWTVPPSSMSLDPTWAKQIEDYVGVVVFSNRDGINDIFEEICRKIDATAAKIKPR